MTEMADPRQPVRFGEFEVDLQARRLFKQGTEVRLREQLFVLLETLIERGGMPVPRETLQKRLWPGDTLVDFEINLNTLIARLREALGDSAENPRYIETLPKRGYRFLAETFAAGEPGARPRRRLRLVVLPFSNAGGDPSEDDFSDSVTDEMITALCQIAPDHLAVIARSTAMHYKGSRKDAAHIGRELGADYLVEGAARRGDGRVALNVQVVQAADQAHIFAGRYDAEMSELFGLQNRVAAEIVGHLPPAPGSGGERPARKKPSEDVIAYQLYLRGRQHLCSMTPEGMGRAKEYLDQALGRDPKLALAHDALGELFWWTGFFGHMPAKQASFLGMGAVLRAIEIDPSLGESHALLGQFRQKIDYNWPEVRREMALALEMAPSSPLVRQRYAVSYLLPHGRLDEAIAQAEVGLEFDPLNWMLRNWLSIFLWLARDPGRALQEALVAETIDPKNWLTQFVLSNAFTIGGDLREATARLRRTVELTGGAPQMLGWLGFTLAADGKPDEARAVLERIKEISGRAYVAPTSLIWVNAGLREYDEALRWIERAIDERDSFIIPIKTYPCLDPLRGDPRFQALVGKMNLEP